MTTPTRYPTNPAALDQVIAAAPIRLAYARDAAATLALDDLVAQLGHPRDLPPVGWERLLPPEVAIAAMTTEVDKLSATLVGVRADQAQAQRRTKALQLAVRRLLAEAPPEVLAELAEAAR
jgi:hypothetical protein